MAQVTVRLTAALAGPKGSWNAGDEYTCDPAEANRLLERELAVPLEDIGANLSPNPLPEAAVAAPEEKAVAPKAKPATPRAKPSARKPAAKTKTKE